MTPVLVLHGPNLSRLGKREPHLYGTTTLKQIDDNLVKLGASLALDVVCKQTNHEGVLIDEILAAADAGVRGILLNSGAYAHTSLAIADAVRAVAPLVVVEVHLTNTAARGRPPLVGEACRARVEGFGADSYVHALRALAGLINEG
jgi:3-dehydroquinate dehydratase II